MQDQSPTRHPNYMSASRPDPITTAVESMQPSKSGNGVDPAALQRRLQQLNTTMGFVRSPQEMDASSESDSVKTVDVLGTLKAKPEKHPVRSRMPTYVLAALPVLCLSLWWLLLRPQPMLTDGGPQFSATKDSGATARTETPAEPPPAAPTPVIPTPAHTAPVAQPPAQVVATTNGPSPAEALAAQEDVIRQRLESWRHAWSARDVDAYLAHYGAGFRPAKEPSREAWAASRRRVISSRPDIQLALSQMRFQRTDEQHWNVEFLQDLSLIHI